ncbi:MAG: homoserine dehydrogenase [Alphaproteobacteria bacterium]|nr:homoserine dehydrogenase [Alphaproteobacteria bacterium]
MGISDKANSFKIGIAGLGTVGVGVVKILQENAELVAKRAGRTIEIVSVTAANKDKDRGVDLSSYEWVENLNDMATDERLDCVVELIGGSEGPVLEMVETAIGSGKDVVTANKALMAHHGYRLAGLAEEKDSAIAYEAGVAGGIPVIKTLREGLAANKVESVSGILNGTCNYILSDMRVSGRNFDEVLKEAQEKGYAEADPTFDVDGIDTAHKLTLLAALGFGAKPDFDALETQGIRYITAEDINFADELGYRIKLLGTAKVQGEKIMQAVEPCLVPTNSTLGRTSDVYNAVLVQAQPVWKNVSVGLGAGEGPTASSVVADIIDLARDHKHPIFGVPANDLESVKWGGSDDFVAPYYMRFEVEKSAEAQEGIKEKLEQAGVGVEKTLMKDGFVVAMSKAVSGGDVRAAVKDIAEEAVILRIEE